MDSFFPYRVKDRWYGLYGGHLQNWEIGLAEAPELAGPWTRCPSGNPIPIEKTFIENPLVTKIGGLYVAIYDSHNETGEPGYHPDSHRVGYSWSADGIHWSQGERITVQPDGLANWSTDIRTPLSLIEEGNGIYTGLYTGTYKGRNFFPVGMVRLKLTRPAPSSRGQLMRLTDPFMGLLGGRPVWALRTFEASSLVFW